jgi:hypothetical protein
MSPADIDISAPAVAVSSSLTIGDDAKLGEIPLADDVTSPVVTVTTTMTTARLRRRRRQTPEKELQQMVSNNKQQLPTVDATVDAPRRRRQTPKKALLDSVEHVAFSAAGPSGEKVRRTPSRSRLTRSLQSGVEQAQVNTPVAPAAAAAKKKASSSSKPSTSSSKKRTRASEISSDQTGIDQERKSRSRRASVGATRVY